MVLYVALHRDEGGLDLDRLEQRIRQVVEEEAQ